jgi:hypothetical protein
LAGNTKKDRTVTVTFKVSQELHDLIRVWGSEQRDETGLPLTVHTAARRLMNAGIQASGNFENARKQGSKK